MVNKATSSSSSTHEFDPQTEADRQAQTIIVGGLRHHFPGITVIGEEEQDDANVPSAVLEPSFFDNLSANVGFNSSSFILIVATFSPL